MEQKYLDKLKELEPLKITKAELVKIPDKEIDSLWECADTFLLIHFNRVVVKDEIDCEFGTSCTYGLKFWIKAKNKWEHKPYGGPKSLKSYRLKDNNKYQLTHESFHHPLKGCSDKTDIAFRKGNIESLKIELYQRNKYKDSEKYKLKETFIFKDI